MSGQSVFELKAPTKWAEPPSLYSFSSLQKILDCPRRWQLIHSQWGDLDGFPQREHPSAVEGQIVHEALDMLTRKLGQWGSPPIGSKNFQKAVEACGFWSYFERRTKHYNKKMANHPLTGPYFVLRTHPRDLANRAIRLFRKQYHPNDVETGSVSYSAPKNFEDPKGKTLLEILYQRKAISEVKIKHPSLPFVGFLDLATIDNNGKVSIIDFKTGIFKPIHKQQLRIYALLWWRSTAILPERIEARYLNDAWFEAVSESDLEISEKKMAERIDRAKLALSQCPADPVPGQMCGNCPVRAKCDEGWSLCQKLKVSGSINVTDIELEIVGETTVHGFLAKKKDGKEVNIVCEENFGVRLLPLFPGEWLRVLGATNDTNGKQYKIQNWTELFKI